MRVWAAFILAFAAALAGAGTARASGPVGLQATVGFNGQYRVSAWAPVRVSVTNRSQASIAGEIRAQGAASSASPYATSVILPAGTTKHVTLYVPGDDVQGVLSVSFRSDSRVLARTVSYPTPLGDVQIAVGAVTDNSARVWWLHSVHPRGTGLQPFFLSPSSVDTEPDALATFDALVVSNADTSVLSPVQLAAIESYVYSGGTLILVGGQNWQTTLSPLPARLLPGKLSGQVTVKRLAGLGGLGAVPPPRLSTLSVLRDPKGVVLAAEHGVPLVVRQGWGDGTIDYLAFDPADAPVAGWKGGAALVTRLVTDAIPLSMRRLALQPADRVTSFRAPPLQAYDISSELANLGSPLLSFVLSLVKIALVVLIVIAVAFIGPRLLHLRRLSWVVVAVAAALSAHQVLDVVPGLAASNSQATVIAAIPLEDQGASHAYLGLFAPVAGRYQIDLPRGALITPLTVEGATAPNIVPLTSQGSLSSITLEHQRGDSMADLALDIPLSFPGRLSVSAYVAADGTIHGSVYNDSDVPLYRPALIAGEAYQTLPTIPAHGQAPLSLLPRSDPLDHAYPNLLQEVYGTADGPPLSGPLPLGGLLGPEGLPSASTLSERIRNAANALPEALQLPSLGEVTFVAWTDARVLPVTVNGSVPQVRELSLLMEPVSVAVRPGSGGIPPGVLGARVLRVDPVRPLYPCCGPTLEPITLGTGGSATFSCSLPQGVRFSHLGLAIYAGGYDPSSSDYSGVPPESLAAFDWRSGRWVWLNVRNGRAALRSPGRFVSGTGALLLHLRVLAKTGELSILNPLQDIALYGNGRAA